MLYRICRHSSELPSRPYNDEKRVSTLEEAENIAEDWVKKKHHIATIYDPRGKFYNDYRYRDPIK